MGLLLWMLLLLSAAPAKVEPARTRALNSRLMVVKLSEELVASLAVDL